VHPSIIVKMTFYDLIQTWSKLLDSEKIVVYHDIEIDRAGIELEGLGNKFWGMKSDPVLDFIRIAREYHSWLQFQIKTNKVTDEMMFKFFSRFYQKEGLVDFNEKDPLQKIIYDRLIAEKRKELKKRKKYLGKLRPEMTNILELQVKNQAIMEWDRLFKNGKLLYYPPKKKPIF
jgi:hypothetical protein